MRVIYKAPRGQRFKKTHFGSMRHISEGDYKLMLYWCEDKSKWINLADNHGVIRVSSHNYNITNLKKAIRHIRKHDEIPKGSTFVLCNDVPNHNIIIIK